MVCCRAVRLRRGTAAAGFVLPLVLVGGLVLLLGGMSLQAMALQGRARTSLLLQEGRLSDGFLSAAMVFTAQARQGQPLAAQQLPAGRFQLASWQGAPEGPARFSVLRLAAGIQPQRSRGFQLDGSGLLKPVLD